MSEIRTPRPIGRGAVVVALCLAMTGVGPGLADRARGEEPEGKVALDPKVESILRPMCDYFRKAEALSVVAEQSQTVGDVTLKGTITVAAQRPNRLAVRTRGDTPGLTVVSDGKTLFTAFDVLRKYAEAPAPAAIADLMGDPLINLTLLQGSILGHLLGDDPLQGLTDGVKTATYAGLETIEGMKVHHLKFVREPFDSELWVSAEGDPVVRRSFVDLSKSVDKTDELKAFKNPTITITQDLKDWRVGPKPEAKEFVFVPPSGARKVESLFGESGKDEPSPLVGKSAPDVRLDLLEGGTFQLKDHRDAHVVMLDFWATWCGPCVEELPVLAEVAAAYKGKGVVFCAVNQAEEPAEVKAFLKENKLDIPVALDAESRVGGAYGAQAIPMLVLIDKKGLVQAVHVGYSPAIKATLRKELDALLAGKELANATPDEVAANVPKLEGFEESWTIQGLYTGVSADGDEPTLYAIQAGGRCDVLDLAGKLARRIELDGAAIQTAVRLARQGKGSKGLLSFSAWGATVLASTTDGKKMWEETGGQGVNDVWPADLDGDGADEVIVGYNASTGLHVFSNAGKRLWQDTNRGNIWHVTSGDLDGDHKPEVICTSAEGKVHLFGADGKSSRTLDPKIYASMVKFAPAKGPRPPAALAVGSAEMGESLVALKGDGQTLWTVDLPESQGICVSMAVAPDGARAALGFRGGRVVVVDLADGKIVGRLGQQGKIPAVEWALPAGTTDPLLVVATGRQLNAFRLKPAP